MSTQGRVVWHDLNTTDVEKSKRFYSELKRRFGLSAQPAIRVIGKVGDAYATLKANIDAGNYGPPGSERRKKVHGLAKLFQQALGMEAKLRQYSEGETFVEKVARKGGDEMLARVWTSPESLPSLDEIHDADKWIDRVGGGSISAS